MRQFICVGAALIIGAAAVPAAAKPAAFQLNKTTWTYVDPDKKVKARESIDADGNYIENSVSGKHIDHGTSMMKDGKACFTSSMTKDGELCWTVQPVRVGHSIVVKSAKGTKLKVTRVAYTPLSMPK